MWKTLLILHITYILYIFTTYILFIRHTLHLIYLLGTITFLYFNILHSLFKIINFVFGPMFSFTFKAAFLNNISIDL